MGIIDFTEAAKGVVTRLTIIERRHDVYKCGHCNLELDPTARTVKCRSCGAIIDPFDALMEYANNERRFIWEVSGARAAIDEFKKIEAEWTPTQKEKRRIAKAKQFAKLVNIDADE